MSFTVLFCSGWLCEGLVLGVWDSKRPLRSLRLPGVLICWALFGYWGGSSEEGGFLESFDGTRSSEINVMRINVQKQEIRDIRKGDDLFPRLKNRLWGEDFSIMTCWVTITGPIHLSDSVVYCLFSSDFFFVVLIKVNFSTFMWQCCTMF